MCRCVNFPWEIWSTALKSLRNAPHVKAPQHVRGPLSRPFAHASQVVVAVKQKPGKCQSKTRGSKNRAASRQHDYFNVAPTTPHLHPPGQMSRCCNRRNKLSPHDPPATGRPLPRSPPRATHFESPRIHRGTPYAPTGCRHRWLDLFLRLHLLFLVPQTPTERQPGHVLSLPREPAQARAGRRAPSICPADQRFGS